MSDDRDDISIAEFLRANPDLDVDEECLVTVEMLRARLAAVELQLAVKLGLPAHGIRRELLNRDRRGELIEDKLVMDWHDLYSSYVAWRSPSHETAAQR